MNSNHAVTSLTDLLGRLSLQCAHQASTMQTRPPLCRPCLRYADRAFAMQTVPPLCRPCLRYADRASTMQTVPPLCRPCFRFADRASAMQTVPPLCRPDLRYANPASAMQTVPPLCSKRASTWLSGIKILLKIRVFFLIVMIRNIYGLMKLFIRFIRKKEDIWRNISGLNFVCFVVIFELKTCSIYF